MNYNYLCKHAETGDLLLFKETWWFSRLIQYFTNSKYSHCGIIIKDPSFTDIPLQGLYLLESTGFLKTKDAEDNVSKFGVQLTPYKMCLTAKLTYIGENCFVNVMKISTKHSTLFTPSSMTNPTMTFPSIGSRPNFNSRWETSVD